MHRLDDVEMAQLIPKIDLDRSGTSDYLEFEMAMHRNLLEPQKKPSKVSAADRELVCAGAFRTFDHLGTGRLTRDELLYICRHMGGNGELSVAELDLLMNDLGVGDPAAPSAGLDYAKFAQLMAPTLAAGSFEHM